MSLVVGSRNGWWSRAECPRLGHDRRALPSGRRLRWPSRRRLSCQMCAGGALDSCKRPHRPPAVPAWASRGMGYAYATHRCGRWASSSSHFLAKAAPANIWQEVPSGCSVAVADRPTESAPPQTPGEPWVRLLSRRASLGAAPLAACERAAQSPGAYDHQANGHGRQHRELDQDVADTGTAERQVSQGIDGPGVRCQPR